MKYENTFKAIDQILWKEQGCGSELDYLEQKSWMLFLKYLDDLETEREEEAELEGKTYKRLVTGFYRWSQWATPKKKDTMTGKMVLDTVNAMSGDDLVQFVDQKLFPYLKDFQNTATTTDTLEYKIGEIFGELHNKIRSGFNMREIINMIDELHFQSAEDKHEMTVLYESNIQRMGNAGRNGGEYYTPRPLIRGIIKVVDPKIGETVYDPACGSAGFLCEAFIYMKDKIKSVKDHEALQRNTFYGREKKVLPYIIATMNMIFHGVSAPNISHGNTLATNLATIQESDRKNVILANPPFGGNERGEVLQNFEIRTSETAYMFMQHFIKTLKAGGRAGIVIKNTFLSNGDASAIRKMLLENCNLHTVLDLPSGVFTGAGVKTVVLFFTKGEPTEKIWYYQVDKHYTKTKPLIEDDLEEFLTLQKTKAESAHSWNLNVNDLDDTCDLSVKNPDKVEVVDERTPPDILSTMINLSEESTALLKKIEENLNNAQAFFQTALTEMMTPKEGWKYIPFEKCLQKVPKQAQVKSKDYLETGRFPIVSQEAELISGYWDDETIVYSHKKPVVVFGDHTKNVKFIDFDFVIGADGTHILLPIDDIDSKFFYYVIKSIKLRNLGYARHYKLLKETSIPIPQLTEQLRIVEYLDTAFAKIEILKSNFTKLSLECDTLKQSLLKQVFE